MFPEGRPRRRRPGELALRPVRVAGRRRAHAAGPGRRARPARRSVLADRVPGTEVTPVDDPASAKRRAEQLAAMFADIQAGRPGYPPGVSALPGVILVEVVLIFVADVGSRSRRVALAPLPGSAGT